jgi:hypothetical protein
MKPAAPVTATAPPLGTGAISGASHAAAELLACEAQLMPIGYLVSVAVVAWCTLFAVRPPRPRQSSPSSMAFRFGFLVNELPFVALVWLVAATVLAAVQGDLVSPVGLVGVGVAIVATVGLVVIVRRALLAKPVLARALADFGRGSARGETRSTRWARILLWPFPTRGRQVERIANLVYGDRGRSNRLDVYRPRGRRPDGPTIVHLHGGAFRRGNKSREARPLLHRLARRGCVCISANYRLTPGARFLDQLIDAKRVVAWVRQQGPRYGADPHRVIIAGSSRSRHGRPRRGCSALRRPPPLDIRAPRRVRRAARRAARLRPRPFDPLRGGRRRRRGVPRHGAVSR